MGQDKKMTVTYRVLTELTGIDLVAGHQVKSLLDGELDSLLEVDSLLLSKRAVVVLSLSRVTASGSSVVEASHAVDGNYDNRSAHMQAVQYASTHCQ